MDNNTFNSAPVSEQKLAQFLEAVTAYAEEQSDAIHKEVEAFKEARLQKAEQEVLQESYVLIQKEQEEQRQTIRRDLSGRETAARAALLARRQAMMDEVFSLAKDKLAAYTETPEYDEGLRRSLTEMAARLPAEGTVYTLARKDEGKLPALSSLCPAGSRIEVSADITLGGIRGENLAAGILLDDTLDTRLSEQRDWFLDHSGLTIE